MTPLRQRMLEELPLRNLSETTIQTYLRLVERFGLDDSLVRDPARNLGRWQRDNSLLLLSGDFAPC